MACESCNLAKSDMTPSEWRPEGLDAWVYALEEKLAQKYRMKPRGRRTSGLWCWFCGKPIIGDSGCIELYDMEDGAPLKAPTHLRTTSEGGETQRPSLAYPGNGAALVRRGDWSGWKGIAMTTHFECGPDCGYWIPLDRLSNDWEKHLSSKVWYASHMAETLRECRQVLGVKRQVDDEEWFS